MVSPVPHSASTSLLLLLSYSLFSDTNRTLPHIFLHLSLLMATNSSSSLTLPSSIALHILLLAYYDVTGLFLTLSSHPLVHIFFLLLAPALFLLFTPLLLTPLLSPFSSPLLFSLLPCPYSQLFLSFLVYLLLVLLLLLLVCYKSNCLL